MESLLKRADDALYAAKQWPAAIAVVALHRAQDPPTAGADADRRRVLNGRRQTAQLPRPRGRRRAI